jgi:hypothetical protein
MKFHLTPLQIEKRETIQWLTAQENKVDIPSRVKVTKEQLASLEGEICGKVVWPWSPGYDTDKKSFNDVFPANPFVIVYVACYQDIRICLEFARVNQMQITLRSGAHSFADYSVCDGMVIDISGLKSNYVDPANYTVWVEAGISFADLNPALEFYGMHLPGGGCPTVCVAGYMQGGGYGLTSRNFGIHSDCVLEFTMMLADGQLVVANPVQNKDLFWAVRGGTGGNFGVLLSVKYKIFPLGLIWGLQITWDFENDPTNASKALYSIQENYLTGYKHPKLGIETLLFTDIAKDNHRKVLFGAGFIGTEAELNVVIAPLMVIPGATIRLKKQGKYSDVNNWVLEGIPDVPPDVKFYGRSAYISKLLTIADYTNILNFFKTAPNAYSMVDMEGYGGEINRYPVTKSSFIHRNVPMDFFCLLFFDKASNDQEKNRLWMIKFYDFMARYSNGHSYQNYPNRDQSGFQWAYWGSYYNQLVVIKNKYNPSDVFAYQQAIGGPLEPEQEKEQIMHFDITPVVYESY